MYAWFLHELTASDDLVVKTVGSQLSNAPFVRIVYMPGTPEFTPEGTRLDRSAFVGRGTLWTFQVHYPSTDQEKLDCATTPADIAVNDEQGAGTIPAYIYSPGSQQTQVPAVRALPCFVLQKGGLGK
jgi:hypothetical protein